jgi:GT2 family glycosyltransferase
MQPRVTAILVARNGAEFLEHTLAALRSQTRPPEAAVFVDSGSADPTAAILSAAQPTVLVTDTGKHGFSGALARGIQQAPPANSEDDWLWLLAQDSAPHPRALENLLGAVEIAPSVAVAGPKLMRWDRPDVISEYGQTITRLGSSVLLVEDELDQAQHDHNSDLLGVSASGMLVRRSVWAALGGFDAALPSVDAALDFSIRARLAGHRVIGVPSARILSSGGPELFGRASLSAGSRATVQRTAQLHRRLAYSRRVMLPLHWLSLLPLAIFRSIGALIFKHPSTIPGEFTSAFKAAFSPSVGSARRNLNRTRRLSWAAIAPLRMSSSGARELRAGQYNAARTTTVARTRVGFFSGGGAWSVLIAAVAGVLSFSPLIGSTALVGGALAPLSTSLRELWSNVGYGWHGVGGGFVGAADPFSFVLAVLGSTTPWQPSIAIVVFYVAAMPLAALGAWWCAVRFSERAWPPAVAALLWAFAPPLLSSMTDGYLGAVIAHVLLPWFVMTVLSATRNWSAAAAAAILFAAITASAPSIAPALVLALIIWMIARPRRIPRLLGVVVPAAALFAPLVVDNIARGTWASWIADPGIPVRIATDGGWHFALGAADSSLHGWDSVAESFGLPTTAGPVLAAALLAPLALLAVLSLFMRSWTRSVPALVLALFGFVTAVLGIHLQLALVGSSPVGLWPGSGLSLFWLGLTGAVVVALDTFAGRALVPALVVAVASMIAVGPLVAATANNTSEVTGSTTASSLPAFVVAESASDPALGTLELEPQPDGGIAVTLHRGAGTSLDETSTLSITALELSETDEAIATLVGNLTSRSGLDVVAALNEQHIGFVLLDAGTTDVATALERDVAASLDGNAELASIGDTVRGRLWHFQNVSDEQPESGPAALDTPLGIGILAGQAFIFFIALMLAVPTTRGRTRSTVADNGESAPGFDEDENN